MAEAKTKAESAQQVARRIEEDRVTALERERAAYKAQGKPERAAEVDADLKATRARLGGGKQTTSKRRGRRAEKAVPSEPETRDGDAGDAA